MKIGELKENEYGTSPPFEGWIRTLDLELSVQLHTANAKASNSSPDYQIYSKGRGNYWVQIGNAWKKIPRMATGPDQYFLSITIDDLSFDKPINVAAFKSGNETWDVTWRRRQDRSENDPS